MGQGEGTGTERKRETERQRDLVTATRREELLCLPFEKHLSSILFQETVDLLLLRRRREPYEPCRFLTWRP